MKVLKEARKRIVDTGYEIFFRNERREKMNDRRRENEEKRRKETTEERI